VFEIELALVLALVATVRVFDRGPKGVVSQELFDRTASERSQGVTNKSSRTLFEHRRVFLGLFGLEAFLPQERYTVDDGWHAQRRD
jgi:hypothetical protein